MKTAMQEFLDWMELDTHTQQEFFDKASELLTKEKEQIVKAYNHGCIPEPYLKFWHGVHYYGELYNETDTLNLSHGLYCRHETLP
jgi:hypothetical protein